MPAKKSAANGPTTAKTVRNRVALPSSIESEEDVVWPGQSRNGSNGELREQLTEDVEAMEFGSVRAYNISGDAEQAAFLTLFRSVVKNVHNNAYGVSAIKQSNRVIVKLGKVVTRTRK